MALNIGVTDTKAEIDGIWVPFPLNPEIEVKIARFMNHAHEKALKRLRQPYTSYGKALTEAQERRIFIESLAEAVLLDWKGIKDGEQEIAYSKEEAMRILSLDEARDFRDFIATVSSDMDTFRKERIAAEGKP